MQAGCGGRVDSVSAYYTGGLPIKSWPPTSVTNVACREHDWPPCRIHAYTVYTPIGGKGRCRTSCDLQDHSTQARKSAGKISTLNLKPISRTHEVQNRSNQWLHKMDLGPDKKFKKKKQNKLQINANQRKGHYSLCYSIDTLLAILVVTPPNARHISWPVT